VATSLAAIQSRLAVATLTVTQIDPATISVNITI
jgi:hypothetical protein